MSQARIVVRAQPLAPRSRPSSPPAPAEKPSESFDILSDDLLECLDHSPAGSLHSSLQAAVNLWIAAAIALLLCLRVGPILDSSLWAMEYLFLGSHAHRTICFLSFLRCTYLRMIPSLRLHRPSLQLVL